MTKFIIIGTTLAALVVPSVASANVERYQAQSATFTMTQPANEYNQWANVWTHDFKVDVNPCDDTFSGSGIQTGHDANGDFTGHWTISGKFLAGNKVNLTATRTEDDIVLK